MRRGGLFALVLALVVQIGLMSPSVTPAAANDELATMTADELPTWQTNGTIWSLEHVNGVVYVGGTFTSVRPPGAAPGTDEVPRTNFAAFDADTGNLLPCALSFTLGTGTAVVRALEASPDGSRLYVGGWFSDISGTSAANLVSIDTNTCTLTPWASFRRPAVNAQVRAVAATSDSVFFGGDFTSVESQTRTHFAAVSADGTLSPATVTLNATVRGLVAAPEVNRVYVGGDFSQVNGSAVRGVVALNATTGAVVQTFPGWIPNNSVVRVMVRDDMNFYIGAEGTGGGVFDGRIAARASDGQMLWKDECLGATMALAPHEGVLYSGSHAHDCSRTEGGFPDGKRYHLLAQAIDDKHILPWFPNTNGGIGEALGPRAMVIAGDQLWVGGEFTAVNQSSQYHLTRFAMEPDTGYVHAPILSVTSQLPGKVRVSWTAGFDLDDDAVTYELFRVGTAEPIYTTTVSSREWSRPRLYFIDEAEPGSTVSYNIRTSDGTNISPKSPSVSTTVATSGSGYRNEVWIDNPLFNWRLDEISGTVALDSEVLGRNGVYSGTYTQGVPSALESEVGTSVTFGGSSNSNAGRVSTQSTLRRNGPQTYSIELWFRTSTTQGGKLIGFGNSRTGTSSRYDRHVYMNNAGNILFGNYPGGYQMIKSPDTYRNNHWHHLVATLGENGMRLYLNGLQVASNSNVKSAQIYEGWWKVGYDNLNGWPERPAANGFAGTIDEVAIYDHELHPLRIFEHYRAGRPSAVNDTTPPTTPTGLAATAEADGVSLSWNASTDNLLLAGYEVHRSTAVDFTPSNDTKIATTEASNYVDKAVSPGSWHYRVLAVDAVGNKSQPSATVSAEFTDQTPPTTPGNVSAVAYGTEVDVTWSASTDNVGVTGYDIHRTDSPSGSLSESTKVGTVNTLTFTEADVSAGTWFYRVVARDGVGNTSTPSDAVEVTTVAMPSSIDLAAADELGPSATYATTLGANSTLPGATLVPPDDPRFTYRGAGGFTFGASFPDDLMYMPTSRYPNTWGLPSVSSVEFVTDAPAFEIYTKYANPAQAVRVKVDGKRLSDLPQPFNGSTLGSRHVYKIDFGSAATRRITIESLYMPFGGIYLPAGSSIWQSPPLNERWIVLGDSISGGSGENTALGLNTWLLRAANYLGWDDPWNHAIGGTGYIANGNGSSVPFVNRVASDIAPFNPDKVIVWGGYNDMLEPQAQIASAADTLYATIAGAVPGAHVYVVGPWSPSGAPEASLAATDETLRGRAAAAGLPFVSPITGAVYDAAGQLVAQQRPWITGTGNTASPTGDGNADQFVGSDGRHPTDAGHAYIAKRMALALEQVADILAPTPDTTPPTAPGNVTAAVNVSSVDLAWLPSTDDVQVASYEVHRSDDQTFTPASATKVIEVNEPAATEVDVPAGTWYYKVVAKDTAGNVSAPSEAAEAVVGPEPPEPVTLSTVAVADTYVHASAKTTNFGGSSSMTVHSSPEQISYLRFALPEAPEGRVLALVTLRVRTTTSSFAGSEFAQDISLADNDWDEMSLLWDDRPAIGATLGGLPGGTAINTWYEASLDVSQLAPLLGSEVSIALTTAMADSFQIWSRDYAGDGKPEVDLVFE